MPKFAATLTMLFTEVEFPDRFAAAREAGFEAVEFLFPYDFQPDELAERLNAQGLQQVLFNLPPGDWAAGERGMAALPDRRGEFQDSVGRAMDYARALNCPTVHVMAGLVPADTALDDLFETFVENLHFAAGAFAEIGTRVVIEPLNARDVPGYFLPRTTDARRIIEAAGDADIGLQFDFYHVQIMDGDLSRRFTVDLDIIRHVQISGVPDRHEPDTGEIAYAHLFRLVDELGYDGWVGCEYNPRTTTMEGLGWFEAARRAEQS